MLTDAAPAMIAECRHNLAPLAPTYQLRNDGCGRGGRPCRLDLIVSSMTLHWLTEPIVKPRTVAPLARARRPPALCHARARQFRRMARRACGRGPAERTSGIAPAPRHDRRGTADPRHRRALVPEAHEGGRRADSARRLPAPVAGRAPRRPPRRRRALGGRVTWHIVYGRLEAPKRAHRGLRRSRHRRGQAPPR